MSLDPRIVTEFNKRAPFKLEDATVLVLALVGSDSHNTKIAKDDPNALQDVDYMGVVIPPRSYTFGLKSWEHTTFQVEELDVVLYSFQKFVNLLLKNNPNVLGLLWQRDEEYHVRHPLWDTVLKHRDIFSSRMAYDSFMGYAYSQLKKMESFDKATQKEWVDALELVAAAGWSKDDIIHKKSLPMPNLHAIDEYFNWEHDLTEVQYRLAEAQASILRIHARHFHGYMGEKRRDLVTKHGYDVKNAAHLIRLMNMANEFLATGELQVYRTDDAELIRDIKRGKYAVETIKQWAKEKFDVADALVRTSKLPNKPDEDAADQLTQDLYLEAYDLIEGRTCECWG